MTKKKPKFGNMKKTNREGLSFASKLEASVYDYWKALEMAGEIKILQCQDHIYLSEAEILYIADFKLQDMRNGKVFWSEAKGYETERWPTIKKLWRHYGPGDLHVFKGTHKRPVLAETIRVKS